MWRRNSASTISRSINFKFRRRYSLPTIESSFYLGAYHRFFSGGPGAEILEKLSLKAEFRPESGTLEVQGESQNIATLREKLQTIFAHTEIVNFGLLAHKLRKRQAVQKLCAGAQALIMWNYTSGEFHIMGKSEEDLNTVLESIRQYREKTDAIPIGARAPQIVGKGGVNVAYIRREAPCNIHILERFVFLSGEPEMRKRALRLIRRIIDQKAPTKCKFLVDFLREEIEATGVTVENLTSDTLRTVLLSHGCSDEVVQEVFQAVSVGKPEITWHDLETAILAEDPALLRVLQNLHGSFQRAAEVMSKKAPSKIKLIQDLEEIFGPLSGRQSNLAKIAFEDPASWAPKLEKLKKELWEAKKIKAKGWENLNKPERIKVQRIRRLKKQIEDLRESTESPVQDVTFEIRINSLSIDHTKEDHEAQIRQWFAACGDVVKFDWLKPKSQTPNNHIGDVFCHFATLKEKIEALDTAPYRYIYDPTFRLVSKNSKADVDPTRTCLFQWLPYNYENANLVRLLADQFNVVVTRIHRLGWRTAYVEFRAEAEKIEMLSLKQISWRNNTVSIVPARQLSAGYQEHMRKQDFITFDKQFPFYLEYLLNQNPRGIPKESIPMKWQKEFDFPFPGGYLDKVDLRRDCMNVFLRAWDNEHEEEIWYPRTYGADLGENIEILET